MIKSLSLVGIQILLLLTPTLSIFAVDSQPKKVQVLIVGGGVAGTSTAYHLEKAGISFRVLEMAPRLGGRARTATYPEGGEAEVGLEEFWEGNPALDIIKALKIPVEDSATTFSSFVYQGKVLPFTQDTNSEFQSSILSADELKKYKAWDEQASAIYTQIKTKGVDKELLKLKDISFKDWISQKKFGLTKKTLEFIRIESEPEYGSSWDRLSALDGISEWHIFSGNGRGSFHIVAGNQTLPEAIGKKLGMEHFSLNTQVTNINQKTDGVEVIATDLATTHQKIFKADYVVTTMPLYRLNEIHFSPPISSERQKAIQTQSWGAYFTAHVFVDRAAASHWKINGDDIMPILSDSPLGVIYLGKTPENAPYELLNLLVTGGHAEIFNARTMSFDDVNLQIRTAFDKLWPGFSKSIQRMTFYRYHPRAIAGWPVGRSRYDELSDLMRTPEGRVYYAGDFTEGTHSDDAGNSAIRVSKLISERIKGKK